jgi:hypothetical protein
MGKINANEEGQTRTGCFSEGSENKTFINSPQGRPVDNTGVRYLGND